MKVLISDGDYPHALGVVRNLAREGVTVHSLSTLKKSITHYSKYCEKSIVSPVGPEHEAEFIEFLCSVLAAEKYDLLMPIGFLATKVIAANKEIVAEYCKTELALHTAICRAMNKRKTIELAEKLAVPCPRTVYPQSFAEVESISKELEFPVVIKGLFEAGKQVIAYPKNRQEFLLDYADLCKQNGYSAGSLPMIQEFIGTGGNECLAALYQKGSLKKYVVYKAIRCYPVKGGASSCAVTFQDDEILDYGKRLLDELNWHGIADVEFKRDYRTGKLKLMEINPKFYATIEVAMAAGVNFPYYLCRMAQGESLEFSAKYKTGLIYHYPFSKEIIHLVEKPASLLRVVADTVNPRVKSNVWLKDFKPNVFELLNTLGSFLPQKMKRALKKVLKRP